MKALRDAMRYEAGRVWRDKAKAASHGLFLNEETITETLLLQLVMAGRGHGFAVYPFTKAEETKIGADWEFWFTGGPAPIGLRVQAKRLFPSGKYDSLKPGGKQISDLIARAAPCIPVLVFYNDMTKFTFGSPDCGCSEYRGESYRGCIVASASKVQKEKSKDPSVLRHFAMPLHCLLCDDKVGKSALLAGLVSKNARRLSGLTENTEDEEEGHRLLNDRIQGLAARAADVVVPPPPWVEQHFLERKLAGLAVFSDSDAASP